MNIGREKTTPDFGEGVDIFAPAGAGKVVRHVTGRSAGGWPPIRWEPDIGDLDLRPGDRIEVAAGWAICALPGDDRWQVRVRLERTAGVVRATTYEISCAGGESILSPGAGKRLGLGTVNARIAAEIAEHGGLSRDWADTSVALPRPGRGKRPDIYYAIWAERYVHALSERPDGPVRALLEQWPGETRASLLARLNQARTRGLLTAAPAGKPGGKLTPKAKALLRQAAKSADRAAKAAQTKKGE